MNYPLEQQQKIQSNLTVKDSQIILGKKKRLHRKKLTHKWRQEKLRGNRDFTPSNLKDTGKHILNWRKGCCSVRLT